MEQIIKMSDENVCISVASDEDISKHGISIEGAIVKCIKHVYRYGKFYMPKNIMISILWKAHKGCKCEVDHMDISQRYSLYEYFLDKDVKDPYISQFMKDTKENFVQAKLLRAKEEKNDKN